MAGKGRDNKKPTAAAAGSPKSAFDVAQGKYKAGQLSSLKKDNRIQLWLLGLACGVYVMYFKKFNNDHEPFVGPVYKTLQDDPAKMEEHGIVGLPFRKGLDGITPLPQDDISTYSWRQMLVICGKDNNTESAREEAANRFVLFLNTEGMQANFRYPRRFRFAGDKTEETMLPADTALLDSDVISVMMAAYPTTSLDELKTFPDIMEDFWSDVERGSAVMDAYVGDDQGVDEQV